MLGLHRGSVKDCLLFLFLLQLRLQVEPPGAEVGIHGQAGPIIASLGTVRRLGGIEGKPERGLLPSRCVRSAAGSTAVDATTKLSATATAADDGG
jgi:hypothetical protein